MARKKTVEGGESDLIERGDKQGETNVGLGMVPDASDRVVGTEREHPELSGNDGFTIEDAKERAEFYEADPLRVDHDSAVEDEAAAVRAAHAPTNSASERYHQIEAEGRRSAIKRANFSRLASKRVQRILVGLVVLKNLANTSSYEWSIGQQEKIFEAIDDQLTDVRKAFEAAKKPKAQKSALMFEV
jgi:hypothetical protein